MSNKMTPQHSDPFVGGEIIRLVQRFGITHSVETGTHLGETAAFLAGIPGLTRVDTIEINPKFHAVATRNLKTYPKVHCHMGDSAVLLDPILRKSLGQNDPLLMYLDAHWEKDIPLHAELDVIGKILPDKCVIIIDDIKVPGRNFAHDTHNGVPFAMHWLKDGIAAACPGGFFAYYLSQSERLIHDPKDARRMVRRGVGQLYIIPKVILDASPHEEGDFAVEDNGELYSNFS